MSSGRCHSGVKMGSYEKHNGQTLFAHGRSFTSLPSPILSRCDPVFSTETILIDVTKHGAMLRHSKPPSAPDLPEVLFS